MIVTISLDQVAISTYDHTNLNGLNIIPLFFIHVCVCCGLPSDMMQV